MAPFTWIAGIPSQDIIISGALAGEKVVLNEFVAFAHMSDYISSGLLTNQRSIIITSYLLCGFANFGSVGIQIGAFGIIIPERKKYFTSKAVKAMLAGTLTSFLSAAVAGIFI
jgi:CNT family concentrative nucleoside transporter